MRFSVLFTETKHMPGLGGWGNFGQFMLGMSAGLSESAYSIIKTKNEKSKDYCKADLRQRVLFFITIFDLFSRD